MHPRQVHRADPIGRSPLGGRFKFAVLLGLYFSQGLPWRFIAISLPVVMRGTGVDLGFIGLSSLLALPVSLKFLWAPCVDRWGADRFGHYKSWILPMQIGMMAAMVVMAQLDPATQLSQILAWVLVFAVLAATQDIGCDALAVVSLSPAERPAGNTIAVLGSTLGALVGGAATLWLLDRVGWTSAVSVTALTLLAPLLLLGWYREPRVPRPAPRFISLRTIWSVVQRPGMAAWILLMTFFLMGSAFANPMVRPLLVDQGLSNAEIGTILGVVDPVATVLGLLAVPILIERFGRGRTLVGSGLLQAAGIGLYIPVALGELGLLGITLVYGLEGMAGGMVLVTVYTVCMDKSDPATAATDFTTQFSLMTLLRYLPLTLSGYLAQAVGYGWLFALGMVVQLLSVAALTSSMGRLRLIDRGAS